MGRAHFILSKNLEPSQGQTRMRALTYPLQFRTDAGVWSRAQAHGQ